MKVDCMGCEWQRDCIYFEQREECSEFEDATPSIGVGSLMEEHLTVDQKDKGSTPFQPAIKKVSLKEETKMKPTKSNSFRPCEQRPMFQSSECPAIKTVCKACAECSLEEARRIEEGKRQDRLYNQARIQYDRP